MTPDIIIWLCIAAFTAGFIDAIVGGGGLVQTPSALTLLPGLPVATVIGTLKIPAFTGTAFAAIQYTRKVKIDWRMLGIMTLLAGTSAYAGSFVLSKVHNDFMKPLLLVILVLVAVYTYAKKDFGLHTEKDHTARQQLLHSVLISMLIGFYDGFIGPGAGSFFILGLITVKGFNFLKASAHSKLLNLSTNLGSILFFTATGKILYKIAIPMAISNAAGGVCGARLAIVKGNKFIRVFFLLVVTGIIIRFAWDVFFK